MYSILEYSSSEKVGTSHWEICYLALLAIEKMAQDFTVFEEPQFEVFPFDLLFPTLKKYWPLIFKLLRFGHSWVQYSSSRICGSLLYKLKAKFIVKCIGEEDLSKQTALVQFVANIDTLFETTRALCWQFVQEHLSKQAAQQIVKNLVFLARVFYKYRHLQEFNLLFRCPSKTPSRLELNQKDLETVEADTTNSISFKALHWLFRRLSFIAREEHPIRVNKKFCIFNYHRELTYFCGLGQLFQ